MVITVIETLGQILIVLFYQESRTDTPNFLLKNIDPTVHRTLDILRIKPEGFLAKIPSEISGGNPETNPY